MRALDRSDLWFGAVLAVFLALVSVTLFAGIWTGSFWSQMLPVAGLVIGLTLLRPFIDRLGRALRFVWWVCVGAAVVALVGLWNGQAFNPAAAAGIGLAWAIFDFAGEYFRSRREAEHG